MADYVLQEREESVNTKQVAAESVLGQNMLNAALQRLQRVSFTLNACGWLVLLLTVVSLINCINRLLFGYASGLFWTTFIPSLGVLILAVVYETLRKRGNVLFEEISDELQWNVQGGGAKPLAEKRPDLNARLVLRTFARASDMPLFPGKLGPALYVILNLVLLLMPIISFYSGKNRS